MDPPRTTAYASQRTRPTPVVPYPPPLKPREDAYGRLPPISMVFIETRVCVRLSLNDPNKMRGCHWSPVRIILFVIMIMVCMCEKHAVRVFILRGMRVKKIGKHADLVSSVCAGARALTTPTPDAIFVSALAQPASEGHLEQPATTGLPTCSSRALLIQPSALARACMHVHPSGKHGHV